MIGKYWMCVKIWVFQQAALQQKAVSCYNAHAIVPIALEQSSEDLVTMALYGPFVTQRETLKP